jgi:hypothetical protein
MEHMAGKELVEVFSRDDIDFGIPVPEQRAQSRQLVPLFFGDLWYGGAKVNRDFGQCVQQRIHAAVVLG